jgi:hypothetical protein
MVNGKTVGRMVEGRQRKQKDRTEEGGEKRGEDGQYHRRLQEGWKV